MRTIEALGLTKEEFKKMYEDCNGFNNTFNKNHPSYGQDESYLAFLKAGSEKIVTENAELVKDIIKKDI